MKKITLLSIMLIGLVALSGVKADNLSGTLNAQGSSTVFPVMQEVQQRWQDLHPGVTIEIASVGSGGGFERLSEGTTDLAPMSRPPKADEIASVSFEVKKQKIGLDALSIIVNDANPVTEIDQATLKGIFNGTITSWKLAFPGKDFSSLTSDDIVVYERDENSGTHDYFNEEILNKGDAVADAQYNAQADLNSAISKTDNAIGYSGLAYVDSSVKALDFKGKDQTAAVTPSISSAADSTYALARPLFLVWNGDEANSLRDAVVDYVMSPEGQYIVKKVGYVPVGDEVASSFTAVDGAAPIPALSIFAALSVVGIAIQYKRRN